MSRPAEFWLYLSTSPLFWLALTLGAYVAADGPEGAEADDGVAVPLELDTPRGRLSLLGTTMVFGTPVEVTLSELAVEAFYPADESTAALLAGG